MKEELLDLIRCISFQKINTRRINLQKIVDVSDRKTLFTSHFLRTDFLSSQDRAILHCISALEIFAPENSPQQWATAQNYLGDAYFGRIEGERADNLEESLACYLRALTVFTPESSSSAWANTHYNLARVYNRRIHGEQAENLEQGIEHYQRALGTAVVDGG